MTQIILRLPASAVDHDGDGERTIARGQTKLTVL
jgi:hypothetical protein